MDLDVRLTWLARTWIAISDHRQATKDRRDARKLQLAEARGTEGRSSRPVWQQISAAALWLREFGLILLGYVIIAGVVFCGWSASFIGLHDYAMAHMGLGDIAAWYVPCAFDGAAMGLTLVVAVESMRGRGAITWRVLIVGFTGLSSWINYEHISDPGGRWIAALLPASAVILFEGLMSRARKAHEDRVNPGRSKPRFHILRWVFDFSGTLAIVRAYVLGIELPSQLAEAQQTVADEQRRPKGKRNRARKTTTAKNPPAPKPTATVPAATETNGEPLDNTQPMPRLVHGGGRRDSKASRAREWVLSEWREGRIPASTEIDERFDCATLGRKTLKRLADDGHFPPASEANETIGNRLIASVQ